MEPESEPDQFLSIHHMQLNHGLCDSFIGD